MSADTWFRTARPLAGSRVGPALLVLSAITACADADAYDASRMVLGAPPASVGGERHTGSFSGGDALSMTAELRPLSPEPVKTIHLDVTHKLIEIAPGVVFQAWTYGDQVPGPTVRGRVGDRVRFSMTNRSDEPVAAPRLTTAPLMHSMDFHAAMVAPDDKYRSIAPGQTIEFEFTLNYPGVFMYHCGTPMVLEHISSGMYGMFIVEPRDGYPTQVDREYVVVQSEFYTRPDSEASEEEGASESTSDTGGQPLYVLDTERMRLKEPTYTIFNGRYNGMVDEPLVAEPGERVRLFVMNVGPSNTSSFHVVGTIFDRVWIEGNPDNQMRGMQTVLLGSSQGAIVEFIVPEAGNYIMVDHHFANASQGAVGFIRAGQPAVTAPEHHNIPETAVPSTPEAVQGKLAFESKCLACHSVGEGDRLGPDLLGVTERRTEEWIEEFLEDPEEMFESDPDAQALLARYQVPMPDQNLNDAEIEQLIAYFRWAGENVQPAP